MSKVVVTCALTGVLTDPAQHPVPVTPEQMAREARAAFDAGATVMHVHFRQQGPGKGHLPSWDPQVALEIAQAIREACPGVIFNQSTGVVGPDISGPAACIRAIRPEIAAANAGSLNYLKVRSDGRWAWPPMLFDNPVDKVTAFLAVMAETGALPEFECFDVGIVRCVEMYVRSGLYRGHPDVNLVMGVESGMPADPALLPILTGLLPAGATWQVTASRIRSTCRTAARRPATAS
jgi:3-keto-5-aminohexanoate cleavage enzyme